MFHLKGRVMTIDQLWELCLKFEYDREKLVAGIAEFIDKINANNILDCACGSGFISLDLILNGYNVTCSDGSETMLSRFRKNSLSMGLNVSPYLCAWSDLGARFSGQFDLVMCRGSSLIYAGAWDKNIKNSHDIIQNALINFYFCLRSGGSVYVDTTTYENLKEEGSQIARYPEKCIDGKRVGFEETIFYDQKNKVRIWEPRISIDGATHSLQRRSYYLEHEELIDMLSKSGFTDIQKIDIPGEHYAVFTAKKGS